MRAKDDIDFSAVDWDSVDEGKAGFIYREALEHHKGIIENNNRINDKALGLLSFTMPIMTALAGYFAISWGGGSPALFAAALAACVFIFAVVVCLLLVIIPRGVFRGEGSPGAYFTGEYYKRDMRGLLVGNIVDLHGCILHDGKTLGRRGRLFGAAVVLCACLPAVSFLVFLLWPAN